MSHLFSRRFAAVLSAALILPFVVATPSFAAKNDHGFATSLEGLRQHLQNYCDGLQVEYSVSEDMAGERAGTKEAEPYSKAADEAWDKGVDAGCSWARD